MWNKREVEKSCIACEKDLKFLRKENKTSYSVGKNKIICEDCRFANSKMFAKSQIEQIEVLDGDEMSEGHYSFCHHFPDSPKYLYERIDERVSGHKEAKKLISVAFANHLRRIENPQIPKETLLVTGRTGMGKTLLLKSAAESLNIPMVIVDSGGLTGAGWQGDDIKSCLEQLYSRANRNLEKACRGVIVFDEFDKKAGTVHGNGSEISTISVQEQLLKMVEGGKFLIGKGQSQVEIDTSGIMFVFSGSFERQLTELEKNKSKRRVGLAQSSKEGERKDSTDNSLSDDWLIETGIIKELLGRITTVVKLGLLSKKEIIEAFSNKRDSALSGYQALCESYGIELKLSRSMVDHIVSQILERPLGIRIAQRILSERVNKLLFDAHLHRGKIVTLYPDRVKVQ